MGSSTGWYTYFGSYRLDHGIFADFNHRILHKGILAISQVNVALVYSCVDSGGCKCSNGRPHSARYVILGHYSVEQYLRMIVISTMGTDKQLNIGNFQSVVNYSNMSTGVS